jgi:hypothetical protein
MAILGLVCAAVTLIIFGWMERPEQRLSAAELADAERMRAQTATSP